MAPPCRLLMHHMHEDFAATNWPAKAWTDWRRGSRELVRLVSCLITDSCRSGDNDIPR